MKTRENVVVFWTVLNRSTNGRNDPSANKWVAGELNQGRLRQGWGPAGAQLTESGRSLAKSEWLRRFRDAARRQWPGDEWDENRAESRYKILGRMLQIQPGDLVAIPSVPGNGSFTLATVSSPYYFDLERGYSTYPWERDKPDLGHVIGVSPSSIVTVARTSSTNAAYVQSRFAKGWRSAVNIVRQPEYREAIIRLYNS